MVSVPKKQVPEMVIIKLYVVHIHMLVQMMYYTLLIMLRTKMAIEPMVHIYQLNRILSIQWLTMFNVSSAQQFSHQIVSMAVQPISQLLHRHCYANPYRRQHKINIIYQVVKEMCTHQPDHQHLKDVDPRLFHQQPMEYFIQR